MANARIFKTPKGTDLPLLDLRGKEYLEVKYRIVWFREDHPNWSIETEFIKIGDDFAIAKASIKDESGRIISTGQKHENRSGFADYHEKAESGSIGRALGFLGYGTQFCADELDEGKRIVDSPVEPKSAPQAMSRPAGKAAAPRTSTPDVFKDEDFGEYMCSFGKHKDKKIKDFGEHVLDNYVKWLKAQANKTPEARIFLEKADAYLMSREFADPRLNRREEIA